ncbi:RNA-binding protein [candidate division WWE3 bacterium]|uniref:RNA-binding protein n=1 Tax=candidate division WWE3 bacterium TaxID=2053526 RepID=A0A955LVS0_UNCKA|nr:RNA-binding protein [candidate division WWE3 bacterium]
MEETSTEEETVTAAPAAAPAGADERKLYVGNLPFSTDEARLSEVFTQAGTVEEAIIIRDRRNNNRSKGFGFVTMATAEEAQAAIAMFHEKELEGRPLTVNVARPKTEE